MTCGIHQKTINGPGSQSTCWKMWRISAQETTRITLMTTSALHERRAPVTRVVRWLRWGCGLWLIWGCSEGSMAPQLPTAQVVSAENVATLDAKRAFEYLEKVCEIGPRWSGSPGMIKQQDYLAKFFEEHGAKVFLQPFDAPHPLSGEPVRMQNLIVQWHPEAKVRILLACHYDTRPFPDQEISPSARKGTFIGANDGGSGVALFMEMAHHLPGLELDVGVDMVFFDGEELVFDKVGKYFLGSEYFARQYRDEQRAYRYEYGILVDMIGDKQLTIYQEGNSLEYAPTLVKSVWGIAQRLGVREFIPRVKHTIQDDHLPLNDLAKIPTIDLIDFDYPYWHKRKDIPANCSGESIAKVGRVLLEVLKAQPAPRGE